MEEKLLAIIRDKRRLLQIISFMGVKTRFTKQILVTEFGLKDKSELRPLLALLQGESMIKSARGFTSTLRLKELHEYMMLARLPHLAS